MADSILSRIQNDMTAAMRRVGANASTLSPSAAT